MNFYMKQKVFSWNDRFYIYDGLGNERYYVEGEMFSFGKKLHLFDTEGNELAFISQKLFSFAPKYYVHRAGLPTVEVIKRFTFFKDEYFVDGLGWNAFGDFFDHEYEIFNGNFSIAAVAKEWFSFGDAYRISISDDVDAIAALSVILIIDACNEAEDRL